MDIIEKGFHITKTYRGNLIGFFFFVMYCLIKVLLFVMKIIVATLALGSRPRQRGCKGASQREARESHQGLSGV